MKKCIHKDTSHCSGVVRSASGKKSIPRYIEVWNRTTFRWAEAANVAALTSSLDCIVHVHIDWWNSMVDSNIVERCMIATGGIVVGVDVVRLLAICFCGLRAFLIANAPSAWFVYCPRRLSAGG